jgi:hypothetical protein
MKIRGYWNSIPPYISRKQGEKLDGNRRRFIPQQKLL